MSIQLLVARKFRNKILDKSNLGAVLDWASTTNQRLKRSFNKTEPSVYYHYYSRYTHPHIRERFYDHSAPVQWKNYEDAALAHFLQMPEKVVKPYLIEPNDHILTIGHMFGATKPSELINRIPDIQETIASNNFKGFLLAPDGLEDQFRYYFGNDHECKMLFFSQRRFIPTVDVLANRCDNNKKVSEPVNFLCLASDHEIKAVDILIDAWLAINHLNGATLTLACPNIPEEYLRRIKATKSIKLIQAAPLKASIKSQLLSAGDVSIFLTHIDGGANLTEGMEYGHAVIVNTSHRSKYIVNTENGLIVNFPHEFYKCGHYGVEYDSVEEYLDIVEQGKKAGNYDRSKIELQRAIVAYIENPELLLQHSQNTLKAVAEQNLERSNTVLLDIYKKAIEG
ncbi:hypothetical protein BCM14_1488 [Jezberella montanilacus]|uniref:Glycosyltransferase n=1 Tax=Jezberella montanilacus TaxID=323426 RepID=A0A2T0XIB3_9BURK|nr:glycosyltransferase family 4 protein [Jezberella montanilacus]PRY98655.1 hypothetical protein BCM14_1488 [Jezberella montanilacus]